MFSSSFTDETKIKDQKQQQQKPHKTMIVSVWIGLFPA